MVQDAGTPSDKKNKSHILQKRITTLEHELELRFVYRSSRKVDNFSFYVSTFASHSNYFIFFYFVILFLLVSFFTRLYGVCFKAFYCRFFW